LRQFRYIILLVLACNACMALQAQVLSGAVHQINVEKGLSNGINEFIHRDRFGFVWISSVDGLNCFNGRGVKIYRAQATDSTSMFGTNIQSPFFEKNNGDIWFTTVLGINCFQRKTGIFRRFSVKKNSVSYVNKVHYGFHLSSDRYLWVIVENELFRFDTDTGASQRMCDLVAPRAVIGESLQPSNIHLLALFWDMNKGCEFISFDQHGEVKSRDTLYAQKQPLTTYQALIENDQLAWVACNEGILCLNINNLKNTRLFKPGIKLSTSVQALCTATDKHHLLTAINNEIFLFDKHKGSFQGNILPVEVINNSKKEGVITTMLLDQSQVLWYSLRPKGVNFFNTTFSNFKQPFFKNSLESSSVKNLVKGINGNVFGTTSTKILNFSAIEKYLEGRSIPEKKEAEYYFDAKGEYLWSVSKNGIYYYDYNKKALNYILPFSEKPHDIFVVNNKYAYIGTLSGVYCFDLVKHHLQKISQIVDFAGALYIKDDHLWISNGADIKIYKFLSPTDVTSVKDFPGIGIVNHIIEDTARHCIWVATSNGLLKIKNGDHPQIDTLINEASGLPNQYLYAIVLDKKGNLWLSSNKGIIKYMPNAPPGQQLKHYTTRNGLSSNEYNRGAALMNTNGEIWFGSTQGVDVFHPDSIRDIGYAPQLAITGLKIHDKEWRSDVVAIEMADRIDLDYNQNTLRLELAAMEYTDPEMNAFKAILAPMPGAWQRWLIQMGFLGAPDTLQWTDLGTQNFITYANLAPGNYSFRFTACNSEGIWQNHPKELMVFIHPPYWQTWWFISLLIVCALGLVGIGTAGYYRFRLREQQLDAAHRERALEHERYTLEVKNLATEKELALRRQRDRVSSDMHDELGGGLVSIGAQSKRARKFEAAPEVQSILARIGDIAYHLNRNMRNLSWATDPEMDNLSSLLPRLRKETRDFMEDHAIEGTINLPMEFNDTRLSGEFRLHILRSTLEALNNVAKHAQATQIDFTVTAGSHLRLVLRDNGIGFDPAEKAGTSKGLRSMTKRMEALNGRIEWQRNEEGTGMTVVMEVPMSAPDGLPAPYVGSSTPDGIA